MNVLYLSRKNLLDLLNKLDAVTRGVTISPPAIMKTDTKHPNYPATERCIVYAVEDEDYYKERSPGKVKTFNV